MYFDIGDISEDILKNGRMAFENYLDTAKDFDTTAWGRVPKLQALVQHF